MINLNIDILLTICDILVKRRDLENLKTISISNKTIYTYVSDRLKLIKITDRLIKNKYRCKDFISALYSIKNPEKFTIWSVVHRKVFEKY